MNLSRYQELPARQAHPLCKLFPLMPDEAFEALKEDIRKYGLLEPILLHADDSILDGRHRYRACRDIFVEDGEESDLIITDSHFEVWEGDDDEALAFLLSRNVHRRDLNPAQKAMIAAKLAKAVSGERTDLVQMCTRLTLQEAADQLGVSRRSVANARKILNSKQGPLIKAVESGLFSLNSALAQLPEDASAEISVGENPTLSNITVTVIPSDHVQSKEHDDVQSFDKKDDDCSDHAAQNTTSGLLDPGTVDEIKQLAAQNRSDGLGAQGKLFGKEPKPRSESGDEHRASRAPTAVSVDVFSADAIEGVERFLRLMEMIVSLAPLAKEEYYTPSPIAESSRKVMGSIDLDPTSCEFANQTIKAKHYYTREQDALSRDWTEHSPRTLYCNFPYSNGIMRLLVDHLVLFWQVSTTVEHTILICNTTDTSSSWFQLMLKESDALCFPDDRVEFTLPDGSVNNNNRYAQAIFYMGHDPGAFCVEFAKYGFAMVLEQT